MADTTERSTETTTERRPADQTRTTGTANGTGTTTRSATRTSWITSLPGLASAAHVLLRVGAGLLFMQHGVQKLFGWLGGFGGPPGNTAELFSLMGLAGVLEVFGGAMIVLGLFTAPVAVLLVIEMIAAYVIAHAPQGGFPIQNGGEPALLFALIFLLLAAFGAGPASIDRAMSNRQS